MNSGDRGRTWPACLAALGLLFTAGAALAQTPTRPGPNPLNRVSQAQRLMADGKLEEAEAELREALADHPGYGPALRMLSEALDLRGQADEARTVRRQAYDAGEREPAFLQRLGRDLVVAGNYGLAARVLEKADAIEPLGPGPRRGLALALANAERYDDAVAQLSILLALSPDDVPLLVSRARAEIMAGQDQAALVDVEALLRLDPDDLEVLLLHGKILARMGNLDQAVAVFEKLLARQVPPDVRSIAQADLGSARGQMGDPAAAAEAYREALKYDPGNVLAAANLAGLLLEQQHAAEAEAVLRTALTRNPGASLLYYTLGKTMLAQDRPGDAAGYLREAVKLNALDPRYHYELALALRGMGEATEAEEEMATHRRLLERHGEHSGGGATP